MRIFGQTLDWLKQAIGILLLAGVFLNLVNVCLRYIWGRPFAWTEEIMVFGLLFIVMAGTVIATALDQHLKIDVLIQILSSLGRRILRIFAHCVWIFVCLYLALQSYTVVALMLRLGQTSMATRIPSWIPHSFLLGAFILSALAAVYAILRELGPDADTEAEHGAVGPGTILPDEDDRAGS